jgi:glycosyltransferase involved in cell wall biosynthesis
MAAGAAGRRGVIMASPVVLLLANESPGAPDGIRDYTVRMTSALRELDVEAEAALRCPDGRWIRAGGRPIRDMTAATQSAAQVLLQYNPFMYGHAGFAPWLPVAWRRIASSRLTAVMVHEAFVPPANVKWALMSGWQRAQLRALLASTRVAWASTERVAEWATACSRLTVRHVPVGSNVPRIAITPEDARRRLGLDRCDVVLALFWTDHPSRSEQHVVATARALVAHGYAVGIVVAGAGTPRIPDLDGVTVVSTGEASGEVISTALASGDIFLAPFTDGVSDRRTTLIAALQHGLPVIGTYAAATDSFWRTSPCVALAPAADVPAFATLAVEIVTNGAHQSAMAAEALRVYKCRFSWPILAGQIRGDLGLG